MGGWARSIFSKNTDIGAFVDTPFVYSYIFVPGAVRGSRDYN